MIKKGLLVLVVSYFLTFCGSSKDQVYFTGLKDSTIIDSVYWREVIIHKGDQLSITVASLNPEMDQIVNQANSVSGQSAGGETQSGYFVTEKGILNLPRVGNLKVEGMSHAQLIDTLQILYSQYTKSPIVSVRLMNFRVTVLGEVMHPGQLTFSTPNIDIYQAIGKAGDITPFGRRSDVLLIRQTDSSRLVHRVNLSDPKVIRSSVFQLQSGDLIYVEANQTKKNSSSLTLQLFPVITSGVTLVVALMGIVGRF
jgi:polysaccharide export outer membrane protein